MNKHSARIFLPVLFLFAILILASRPVAAIGPTIKWVDQAAGNDANDGNTEATAYATLQMAVANTESGLDNANRSFIYVKNGTYTEAGIANTCEGFPGSVYILNLDWLTIQAAPGQEPVIKPAAGIISMVVEGSDHLIVDNIDSDQTVAGFDNWHVCSSDDITLRNSRFEGGLDGIDFNTVLTAALIEGNTFTNIPNGSNEVLDFTDHTASNVVIQDNNFINNGRQITVFAPIAEAQSSNFTIQRNLMNGSNVNEHIRLINSTNMLIQNNVIMNGQQEGVYIDVGSTNIKLWQNTFFNNSLEGANNNGYGEVRVNIAAASIAAANIDIRNNIFYANGANKIFDTTVASLPGEDYNLVYNYILFGTFTTFGTNTITGQDPLFVSTTPSSEDLHLTSGSPAIEAAPTLGVTDDKDQNSRPDPAGSDPDMGAYEFPGPTGTIIVIKDTQPDDPQQFSFNFYQEVVDFELKETFFLVDDGSGPPANTWEMEVEPGSYAVTEAGGVTGWTLVDIQCGSTKLDREFFGPAYDPNNNGAGYLFAIEPDEIITCTFVNQPESTSFGFCPAESEAVGYERTDLLGIGQGSATKGVKTRKLVIPDNENVVRLFGQLATVDVGLMKYVRFRYPDNTFLQIAAPTSAAYRQHAVAWWGDDLEPGVTYVKGQFFWGLKGNKAPRAFVLWPTYSTDVDRYANVFETFDVSSENHVSWQAGFFPTQTQVIAIPATQQSGATVAVKFAIVDNDKDNRPVTIEVTVGSETKTIEDTEFNAKANLNLYDLTFLNVAEGVDEVTIKLTSPAPSGLLPNGGDSAAIIGAAVNYACGEDVR